MFKLTENEALRSRLWSTFRSSSRDRVVPATAAGLKLQRVQIRDAMPVNGVGIGQEAVDLGPRADLNDARQRAVQKVLEKARDQPTGETIVLEASVDNPTANPGPAGNVVDDVLLIGSSPFSGFITEATYRDYNIGGSISYLAVRTGSGGSLFMGGQTFSPLGENISGVPDFTVVVGGDPTISARRMRVPVLAGEQIFAIVRTDRLQVANSRAIRITLTFESAEGAPLGARALLSVLGANRAAVGEVTRSVYVAQQQARTAQIKADAQVEVERLRLEQVRAGVAANASGANVLQNPFSETQLTDVAKLMNARRQPVAPAQPRVPPQPKPPTEGAGKTFVSAWNPSFGYIGYLIPNPPVGGRVNVFDARYSVFDITGKLTAQGPVEWIATDAQIPPGARISRDLGTKLSQGISASSFVPGQGFVEI